MMGLAGRTVDRGSFRLSRNIRPGLVALFAFLIDEPGAERVLEVMATGPFMSTVNWIEVRPTDHP